MLTMMAAAIIAPSLPAIALEFQDFPNVELLAKLVLAVPALMIAMVAPFAGRYIDKFGRLKLLYLGLAGYALSGASAYFLYDLYLILASRIVLGMSIGIIMTIAITLVGDYFEGEARQKFVGYQAAFIGLAGVFFMSLGGFLATIHWRVPFLIYLFSLLLIPMTFFFLKEPNSGAANPANSNDASPPLLKVLFLIGTLFMVLFYLFPTQLPFLLKFIGITEPSYAGNALAVNALGMVVSSLFYSSIKQKMSFVKVALTGLLLMGVGYSGTGMASDFSMVLLTVFIAGLGLGLFIANLSFWVMELSPPQVRGKNMGILTACLFIGQFLSPIIAQPIVSNTNLAFLFKSALMVIGLMGLILIGARFVFPLAKRV
jgi:MFS family permease